MRVAVIAVHGVADQKPGDTADAVADLLVASAPEGSSYAAVSSEEIVLAVDPLVSAGDSDKSGSNATPSGATRPLAKSAIQSIRSDFQRAGWAAATGPDLGLDVTRYLLAKAVRNGAKTESYRSKRIELQRTNSGQTSNVDLYEMYWADLSRLSSALPRIVTELFTLVFRLSNLGRETVDNARRYLAARPTTRGARWAWKAFWAVQAGLDWTFVNVLAQLFAQLALLALLLIVFGLAHQHAWVVSSVGVVSLVLGLLWLAYLGINVGYKAAPPALLIAAACGIFFWPAGAPWLFGVVVFALVTALYDAALRVADDRFPLVHASGIALWFLVVIAVVWHFFPLEVEPSFALAALVRVPLYGVEIVLSAVKWWWIVMAIPFVLWAAASIVAARGGQVERASVVTGRLGFLVSVGVFLMLSMALWALLVTPLEWAVQKVDYTASIFVFHEGAERDAASAAKQCPAYAPPAKPGAGEKQVATPEGTAKQFLLLRYQNSTAAFSVTAALILLLVAHFVATFAPSVFAELKWLKVKEGANADEKQLAARHLGLWLTRGYRLLTWTVFTVTVVGAVTAVGAAIYFALPGSRLAQGLNGLPYASCIPWVSIEVLKPLVISAAGLTAALTAVGGLLSRYLPGVRAPLDVALDVDNYFREFPRRNIPRARIFSRYDALLRYVSEKGYDRIVIVSHSQGTVISAELLRFLSSPRMPDKTDAQRSARLRARLGADIRLLTMGSPLRQLYAARFPSLYPWVLGASDWGNGPTAESIGVERWANAFTSGDYVGRWLWSGPFEKKNPLADPLVDGLDPTMLNRANAYSLLPEIVPAGSSIDQLREFEVCLGLGAHTHYFDRGQEPVAWLIDYLISSPR